MSKKAPESLSKCASCKLPYYPEGSKIEVMINAVYTHDCVTALKQALNTAVPWHKQSGVRSTARP